MTSWEDKLRTALHARGGDMNPSFPSRLTRALSDGSPGAGARRWDLVLVSALVAVAMVAIGGITGYRLLHPPSRPAGVHVTASPSPSPAASPIPSPSPSSQPLVFYPTGADLSAPSAGVLWDLVGGYLFRSTDQGATWERRNLPAPTAIGNVSLIDGLRGWRLAGTLGNTCSYELWYTADGAGTWAPIKSTGIPVGACLSSVSFVDAAHGFIAASGTIYRTGDGGRTWVASRSLPGGTTVGNIRAFGSTVLASAILNVYRSTDGGATWQIASWARSADVGFATATRWISLGPNQSEETTDGGATWHTLTTDYGQAAPVAPQVVFATPELGYATVRGEIQVTIDGGTHWTAVTSPGQ